MTVDLQNNASDKKYEALGLLVVLVIATLLRLRHMDALIPWFDFVDETRTAEVTLHLLKNRTLDPAHSYYPAFSFYINAVAYILWSAPGLVATVFQEGPGKAFEFFHTISPQDPVIINVSRFVSLVFGVGSLVLFHFLAKLFLDFRWALFCTLLMALNSAHIYMSFVAKSDTINFFMFMAGFYAAIKYYREGKLGWLIVAAATASLAYVVKNVHQLCIVFPVLLIFRLGKDHTALQILKHKHFWVAAAVGPLTIFLASPYTIIYYEKTIENAAFVYAMSEQISFYHTDPHVWWLDRYHYLYSVVLPFTFGLPFFWVVLGGTMNHFRKHALSDPYLMINFIPFFYVYGSQSGGPGGGSMPYYIFLHVVPLGVLFGVEWIKDLIKSDKTVYKTLGRAFFMVVLFWSIFRVDAFYSMFLENYDKAGPWVQKELGPEENAVLVSVHDPGKALGSVNIKGVWPQDFPREVLQENKPDMIILDTWAVAGFRKVHLETVVYEGHRVAPVVDSLLDGSMGYSEIKRWKSSYLARKYYAAIDPEHDTEIIVFRKNGPAHD